ncbi:hypothetical protein GCWU000325_01003 [Alloprevotella tannerae ATCC 51259]|uniref:Uncharacterized protein n=1 Tax=Alloprevotella tannerae ATCC 51259 TaxID=626522 RepID=C9LFM0_9BACT|nr:hypothetical protein GCWU000325_01003 [Alloprevotella tannerae ATCC 51259]
MPRTPLYYTSLFCKGLPKGLLLPLLADAGLTLCVNPALPKD